MWLNVIQGRLIIYGDNVPLFQVSFFNSHYLPLEWDMYLGKCGKPPSHEKWVIYPQWLGFKMPNLEIYQNVNFSFNVTCKPTFHDMWFRRYKIVANSTIFRYCGVPVPHTLILVARHFFSIFISFTCQKLFLLENVK